MKPQDILFFIVLVAITLYRRGKYLWVAGLISLISAGMLFLVGNLFTSQRLSWYAWGFLICAVIKQGIEIITKGKHEH